MSAPISPIQGVPVDPDPVANSLSYDRIVSRTKMESTLMNGTSSLVDAGEKDFQLTPFERRIIALTVAGYSRTESAKRVGISAARFKSHLSRICDKLCVANPLELILFALYQQLI